MIIYVPSEAIKFSKLEKQWEQKTDRNQYLFDHVT